MCIILGYGRSVVAGVWPTSGLLSQATKQDMAGKPSTEIFTASMQVKFPSFHE